MRILSFEDLRSEKGIPYSKVHLWRLEREGKFPKRVPLSESRQCPMRPIPACGACDGQMAACRT